MFFFFKECCSWKIWCGTIPFQTSSQSRHVFPSWMLTLAIPLYLSSSLITSFHKNEPLLELHGNLRFWWIHEETSAANLHCEFSNSVHLVLLHYIFIASGSSMRWINWTPASQIQVPWIKVPPWNHPKGNLSLRESRTLGPWPPTTRCSRQVAMREPRYVKSSS